jgi:hypothetical protein
MPILTPQAAESGAWTESEQLGLGKEAHCASQAGPSQLHHNGGDS